MFVTCRLKSYSTEFDNNFRDCSYRDISKIQRVPSLIHIRKFKYTKSYNFLTELYQNQNTPIKHFAVFTYTHFLFFTWRRLVIRLVNSYIIWNQQNYYFIYIKKNTDFHQYFSYYYYYNMEVVTNGNHVQAKNKFKQKFHGKKHFQFLQKFSGNFSIFPLFGVL